MERHKFLKMVSKLRELLLVVNIFEHIISGKFIELILVVGSLLNQRVYVKILSWLVGMDRRLL